jgi:hypothetical protein
MKKINISSAAVMIMFLFSSCVKEIVRGNGYTQTETRNISNFSSVSLEGYGHVTITQASSFAVTVTDDENLLPYVETNVSNNELLVRYKRNTWVKHGNLKVSITMPELNGIELSGSGSYDINGHFINNGTFHSRMSGSGDIRISDFITKNAEFDVSGSGKISASGLWAETASVEISGSGEAELSVSGELDAHISGSGTIYYHGTPTVSAHVSGSGKVVKR